MEFLFVLRFLFEIFNISRLTLCPALPCFFAGWFNVLFKFVTHIGIYLVWKKELNLCYNSLKYWSRCDGRANEALINFLNFMQWLDKRPTKDWWSKSAPWSKLLLFVKISLLQVFTLTWMSLSWGLWKRDFLRIFKCFS